MRGLYVIKKEEISIFIDEMSFLGDAWTVEELTTASYAKMPLEIAIRERKSALDKMNDIIGGMV